MINKQYFLTTCAALLSFFASASLQAGSITVSTLAGGLTDTQGPATSGTLILNSTDSEGSSLDFSGLATAAAAGNSDGVAGVLAEGLYACGSCTFELTAESFYEVSFTNSTAFDASFSYDFFISGPSVELVDYAFIDESAGLVMFASADVSMSTTGGSSDSFYAALELSGGDQSHSIFAEGATASLFATSNGFGYSMNDLIGTISGTLAAGETVTFETTLFASVVGPGFEVGGRANIGDPNDLAGTPGFTGTLNVSAIPVPAAVWLFGSGLLGLVGLARRK